MKQVYAKAGELIIRFVGLLGTLLFVGVMAFFFGGLLAIFIFLWGFFPVALLVILTALVIFAILN